jgi:hypothetical protein
VYVPAFKTIIEDAVSPVDHSKLAPEVSRILYPQLSETATNGISTFEFTAIKTVDAAEVPQPFDALTLIGPEIELPELFTGALYVAEIVP